MGLTSENPATKDNRGAPEEAPEAAGPTNGLKQAAMHQRVAQRARKRKTTAAASPSGVNLAALQSFIGGHEGYRNHVYLDSRGNPTAGIGHLLPAGEYQVGEVISAEQITAWFNEDVATAIAGARRDIGAAFDQLDEARQMVVIDMVFNLGAGSSGFGGFQRTIQAIRTGAYAQAAEDMLQSAWAGQVGNRATEDAAIMRSGQMAGGGGTEKQQQNPPGGGAAAQGGAPTLDAIRAGSGVLKVGDHGPAVSQVQALLHIAADGTFGEQTLLAVEAFQRKHHLTADGIVGQGTLDALMQQAPGTPANGGTPAPAKGSA
jgi:lysozyme